MEERHEHVRVVRHHQHLGLAEHEEDEEALDAVQVKAPKESKMVHIRERKIVSARPLYDDRRLRHVHAHLLPRPRGARAPVNNRRKLLDMRSPPRYCSAATMSARRGAPRVGLREEALLCEEAQHARERLVVRPARRYKERLRQPHAFRHLLAVAHEAVEEDVGGAPVAAALEKVRAEALGQAIGAPYERAARHDVQGEHFARQLGRAERLQS